MTGAREGDELIGRGPGRPPFLLGLGGTAVVLEVEAAAGLVGLFGAAWFEEGRGLLFGLAIARDIRRRTLEVGSGGRVLRPAAARKLVDWQVVTPSIASLQRTRRAMPALVLLAAVVLAGCGSGKPSSAPTTTAHSTTTTTPLPTTTPTTAAPATTSTTKVAAIGPCQPAQLTGSFATIVGSAGAGNIEARLVLTNVSSSICTTEGYVGMQLLGTGGALLPTNVVRVTTSAPVPLTLSPGDSMNAVARYSPDVPGVGDNQSGQCQPIAYTTEVTPPNDTTHLVVNGPATSVCEKGTLSIGPLAAGPGT